MQKARLSVPQPKGKNGFGLVSFIIFIFVILVGIIAAFLAFLAQHNGYTMLAGMIWTGAILMCIFTVPIGILFGAMGLVRAPRKLAAIGFSGNACLGLFAALVV